MSRDKADTPSLSYGLGCKDSSSNASSATKAEPSSLARMGPIDACKPNGRVCPAPAGWPATPVTHHRSPFISINHCTTSNYARVDEQMYATLSGTQL